MVGQASCLSCISVFLLYEKWMIFFHVLFLFRSLLTWGHMGFTHQCLEIRVDGPTTVRPFDSKHWEVEYFVASDAR